MDDLKKANSCCVERFVNHVFLNADMYKMCMSTSQNFLLRTRTHIDTVQLPDSLVSTQQQQALCSSVFLSSISCSVLKIFAQLSKSTAGRPTPTVHLTFSWSLPNTQWYSIGNRHQGGLRFSPSTRSVEYTAEQKSPIHTSGTYRATA